MISPCRKCGKLVEMTTEEAYTPDWCCTWKDRLCHECYLEEKARRGIRRVPNQTITRWECNKCRDTWCQRFTVKSEAPDQHCEESEDKLASYWKVY